MEKLRAEQVKKGDVVRLRDGTICEVMTGLLDYGFECRPTDEHPRNTRTGKVIRSNDDSIAHSECDIVELVVSATTTDQTTLLQSACTQNKCDTCVHQYQARA